MIYKQAEVGMAKTKSKIQVFLGILVINQEGEILAVRHEREVRLPMFHATHKRTPEQVQYLADVWLHERLTGWKQGQSTHKAVVQQYVGSEMIAHGLVLVWQAAQWLPVIQSFRDKCAWYGKEQLGSLPVSQEAVVKAYCQASACLQSDGIFCSFRTVDEEFDYKVREMREADLSNFYYAAAKD